MSDRRYQLVLKSAANEILQEMCKKLDATPKDVILDALAVFHFAMRETERGFQMGSFDPRSQNFTGVVTPSLQRIRSPEARAL